LSAYSSLSAVYLFVLLEKFYEPALEELASEAEKKLNPPLFLLFGPVAYLSETLSRTPYQLFDSIIVGEELGRCTLHS